MMTGSSASRKLGARGAGDASPSETSLPSLATPGESPRPGPRASSRPDDRHDGSAGRRLTIVPLRLCVLALVSLLAAAAAGGAPGAGGDVAAGSWTTFGNGPGRDGIASDALNPTTLRATFVLPLDGRITSQVLAARGVPTAGSTTLYATTSQGRVYAVSDAGYIRWTRDFGQLANPCPQLDGYGLTGTPALDTATRTLYTADAFGRVHALDLATGAERRGWPVRVVGAFEREHVW